jgi:hypothetical protein
MAGFIDLALNALLENATAFGLASGVARSSAVYATVSAGHILGIALLIGPILLVDMRSLGALRSLDNAAVAVLRRTATIGLALTILTGTMLFSTKPVEYVANPIFQAKMLVVTAGIINALLFAWRTRGSAGGDALAGGRPGFGLVSISIWLSALLLGRWIAFV